MLLSSSTSADLDTSSSSCAQGDLCDASSLLKLFQDDGKLNDELELDLLSENGIDTVIHTIQDEYLLPHVSLLEYDFDDFAILPETKKRGAASCTFYHYPPRTVSPKRRRVSNPHEATNDYIPSVHDLNLPTPSSKEDEVSQYLQNQLDALVKKFQSSYASIMESKQQLEQQH